MVKDMIHIDDLILWYKIERLKFDYGKRQDDELNTSEVLNTVLMNSELPQKLKKMRIPNRDRYKHFAQFMTDKEMLYTVNSKDGEYFIEFLT